MKLKEFKEKNIEELKKLLADNCQKLRELNFKDANKQLKNVRDLRKVKVTIARLKTLLKQSADKK